MRQFSQHYNLSYNSKGKKNHSQRIGKDYRQYFGFAVIVPE
jgi:regulator of protease activity HflC (stomatin/prohibitin superfamily)